jgi:hypothetical protein
VPRQPAPDAVGAPLHEARDRFERDYILRVLAAQQGNISRTAEALGIERSNLYRKMRGFGIAPSRRSEDERSPECPLQMTPDPIFSRPRLSSILPPWSATSAAWRISLPPVPASCVRTSRLTRLLKSPRRQLLAGSCTGLTCATVSEAEVAVSVCDDVLIANEPIGVGKADRIAALARRAAVTIAIDSVTGLGDIAGAAARAGTTVGVLVDLNVGQTRCGLTPRSADVVALAKTRRVDPGRAAARRDGVRRARGERGRPSRSAKRRREGDGRARRHRPHAAGEKLPCDIVSAGGTGTYDISGRIEGITEIQAGSYVLMDTDYGRLDLPSSRHSGCSGRSSAGRS